MLKAKKGINKTAFITAAALVLLLVVITLLETYGSQMPAGFLRKTFSSTSMFYTVFKKGCIYALVAVSMNLLNGFTGPFSLGQAGFMLLGAYTYAILTIPSDQRESVYYLHGGSAVNFSTPELFQPLFGDGMLSLSLGVIVALICAGIVAAIFAYLIGWPVLRLKSDYLAIATLGFAEIVRAVFQWDKLGPITNGANMLKNFPTYVSFNVKNDAGDVVLRLSTVVPLIIAALCIFLIVLLINSSYGRAFKAIREDEIAAEAMGINLARHKRMAFCISSFFAGVGGAMLAMYANQVQAKAFTSAMTYELLLIVVIGGIGSVSGSCIAAFLYIFSSEWWLRMLDTEVYLANGFKVPFLKNGFRMVVFSIIIMIIVLFFRRGIMGTKELPDLFKRRKGEKSKAVAK